MTIQTVVSMLRQRGFAVTANSIRWAYEADHLPAPSRDWKGWRVFTHEDFERLAKYFHERDKQPAGAA
jgi:hypothetical protein